MTREQAGSCVAGVASSPRPQLTNDFGTAPWFQDSTRILSAQRALAAMVFTMQKNPYTLAAGEKQGEKRNGTHEDNGSVPKKAKKAPAAASLVP